MALFAGFQRLRQFRLQKGVGAGRAATHLCFHRQHHFNAQRGQQGFHAAGQFLPVLQSTGRMISHRLRCRLAFGQALGQGFGLAG